MTNEELLEKITVVINRIHEENMQRLADMENAQINRKNSVGGESERVFRPKTLEEQAEYMLYLINHEAFKEQDTECLKAAYLRILENIREQGNECQ